MMVQELDQKLQQEQNKFMKVFYINGTNIYRAEIIPEKINKWQYKLPDNCFSVGYMYRVWDIDNWENYPCVPEDIKENFDTT